MLSSGSSVDVDRVYKKELAMTAYQDPQAAPTTSTLAIISLISGILSWILLPVLGAIAAVITGNKAKKEIQESAGALGGETMAKIGVILGYVNLAVFALILCLIIVLILLGPGISEVFSGIVTEMP
jgi:hypothetical protein